MEETMQKNSFFFEIMALKGFCVNFSVFRQEYLSSGVNVLTKSVMISDQTKADFVLLN